MGSVDVPAPPCGRDDCAELLGSLARAIERRDVIGMAKGLIMAGSDCGPDEAFAILTRTSMGRNVKLHTIATEMVGRRAGSV
jgi:AmiR/NasT family two-component response regulator